LQYCITRPQAQRNSRGANTGAQLRIARLQAPLRGNDKVIIHSPHACCYILLSGTRRLANCDWMPADNLPTLAGILPAQLRRNGAILSLARRAMEPGHLLYSAPIECKRTAPQIETPICSLPAAQHLVSFSDNSNIHAAQWADHQWNAEWTDGPTRLCIFIPGTHPPGVTLQRIAWVQLNRLRTGVGRFRSCMYKWRMAFSEACECGAKEQTVNHVVLQCPIHRPPHGLHGLTVLDDETIEWLLNTCTEIERGQAVVSTTRSKEEESGTRLKRRCTPICGAALLRRCNWCRNLAAVNCILH